MAISGFSPLNDTHPGSDYGNSRYSDDTRPMIRRAGEAGQPFLVVFMEQLVTGLIRCFIFIFLTGDNRQQSAAGRRRLRLLWAKG